MNAEGDMEAQYDALQREYNILIDENKALKEGGMVADGEWTGGATSTSLNVMRKEYDEKIMNLNEERREVSYDGSPSMVVSSFPAPYATCSDHSNETPSAIVFARRSS